METQQQMLESWMGNTDTFKTSTSEYSRMLDMWHFDDLVGQGASRFIFTNGLNDGWSADSILDNLSPDIIAINMPNGAHHSDLNHMGPRSVDTEDIKQAFPLVIQAMTRWLTEINAEMHSGDECQ